jgi:hypothetical protein
VGLQGGVNRIWMCPSMTEMGQGSLSHQLRVRGTATALSLTQWLGSMSSVVGMWWKLPQLSAEHSALWEVTSAHFDVDSNLGPVTLCLGDLGKVTHLSVPQFPQL